MPEDVYSAVDGYLEGLFVGEDAGLSGALARSEGGGLPGIQVSPLQGKLLGVLVRACGARRVLEIGTLGGYSAICMARALGEGGRVVTLEVDERHAELARESIEAAGVGDRVEVVLGDAKETLKGMVGRVGVAGSGVEPFDMVFIDADKGAYPAYLDLSIRLCRVGGLIVADNVIRGGKVMDEGSDDETVRGAAAFNHALAGDDRVEGVVMQLVGAKGHDGIAMAVVK